MYTHIDVYISETQIRTKNCFQFQRTIINKK